MARARNKWSVFSFKKFQTLQSALGTEVGKDKVVSTLAEKLGQSQTAIRGYQSRKMIPNVAAQNKLLQMHNLMINNKKISEDLGNRPENNKKPETKATVSKPKEVLIPLSVLRRVTLKMPVTSKELDLLEALLTR